MMLGVGDVSGFRCGRPRSPSPQVPRILGELSLHAKLPLLGVASSIEVIIISSLYRRCSTKRETMLGPRRATPKYDMRLTWRATSGQAEKEEGE